MLHIPLADIDAHALPRDRTALDPAALAELQSSIATQGLRMPVEVFATAPGTPHPYALISGFRRLTALRNLAALNPAHQTIPAILRTPATEAEALRMMVEENDIRADLSPWEKGRILIRVVEDTHFPTLDAAVAALHPNASRQKRARLRACANVVEDLDGLLTTPEHLTERQMLRLSTAQRGSFPELFHQILAETKGQTLASQWSALLPTLTEAEKAEDDTQATAKSPARPRRLLHLRQGLTIRREETPTGYLLRFSGPEARRGGLMDDVMDEVERVFRTDCLT